MAGSTEPGAATTRDPRNCLYCDIELKQIGRDKFRVGGSSGGMKLLFGEWAELGEEMVTFDLWGCPQCRTVVFRVPT